MAIFKIEVIKDYTHIKNRIPNFAFQSYKVVIEGIYLTLIKGLAKTTLKNYNPIITDDKAIFTEENDDLNYLEQEKTKLISFLYGDISALKEKAEIKKALSNRWVMKAYNTIFNYVDENIRNTPLMLLNSLSLSVIYSINELKPHSSTEETFKEAKDKI